MKKDFASYERKVEATIVRVTHTVRILLNSTAADLKETLKRVPDGAVVTMVVDDADNEGRFGEIIFTEERQG